MAKKLKLTKNAHLMHINTAMNSLNEALVAENPDKKTINKYLEMVEQKYAIVVADSVKLQEVLTEDDEITKEIDEMSVLEDKVIDLRCDAQHFLKENADKAGVAAASDNTLTLINTLVEGLKEDNDRKKQIEDEIFQTQQRRARDHLTPKLPDLPIEKFDGDLEKYQEFMDSFLATIDKNPKLEDVDKFRYLRMFLEDKREGDGPRSLIEGFSTTEANYKEALKLIQETYGHQDRIIMSHISKLLTLEIRDSADKGALRILFNKVTTHVRSLEVLGVDIKRDSIYFVPIILSKLTHNLRKEWGKRKKTTDNVLQLLQFIEEEIRSIEEARQVENAFSTGKEHKKKYSQSKSYQDSEEGYDDSRNTFSHNTGAALHVNSQKWCHYCQNEEHNTQTCKRLEACSSVEVRSFLCAQQLCFCCMKEGHSIKWCQQRSKLRCRRCGATNHHTLLHEKSSSMKPLSQSEDNSEEKDLESKNSTRLSTVADNSTTTKVLFQTANAYITDFGCRHRVKVVFDTCSDRSYITNKASDKIKFHSHDEKMEIIGYNAKSEGLKMYNVMHAVIESITRPNTRRSVNLVRTDKICAPIKRGAVPRVFLECPYLSGLDLAEDYSTSKDEEIDVLIGLDAYWSLVTGRVTRRKDNPIAVETVLGWMLQANTEHENTESYQTRATSLFMTTYKEEDIDEEDLENKFNKEITGLSSSSTEMKEPNTPTEKKVDTPLKDQPTETREKKKKRKKCKGKKRCSDEESPEVSPEDSKLPSKVKTVIDVSDCVSDSTPIQPNSSFKQPVQLSVVFKVLMMIVVALLTTHIASSALMMSEFASGGCNPSQFTDNHTGTHDLVWNRRGPDGNDIQISDTAIKNSFIMEAFHPGYHGRGVIHKHSSWWGVCHNYGMQNSEDFQIDIQNRNVALHQKQLSMTSYCIQTMSEWWGVLRIYIRNIYRLRIVANKTSIPTSKLRNKRKTHI